MDVIKKFKHLLVKEVSNEILTRKSFGRDFKCFLYCHKIKNNFYSYIIRDSRKEIFQIISNDEKLFNDSLFEGEYYEGVFYITHVFKCDFDYKGGIENLKLKQDIDGEWEYSFNHKTFDERYKKIGNVLLKNIVKDDNFIEIYRDKETNDIIRVKDASTSKKLKNLFDKETELDLPVIFNDRFKKYEFCL